MNSASSSTSRAPRKKSSAKRRWAAPGLALLAVVVLAATVVAVVLAFGDGWRTALGPCVPGREGGAEDAEEGAGPGARELLETPGFEASAKARGDLEAGVVDERLAAALLAVAEEHRLCIDAFKEGHYFVSPNVPDGPLIPEGYGEAGGLPNTHYYGRAADIRRVNGRPVRGNGTDPAVVGVGEALAELPARDRPDQIIGPPDWTEALGRAREEGWVLDEDQLLLHEDHLHLGFRSETSTSNTE